MPSKILICKHKVKYSSENAAIIDIERLQKISKRTKVPVRAYLCECGSWHLTSKLRKTDIVILELKSEIESLKKEIESLKKHNSSKQEHDIAVDVRVIKLHQVLSRKNKIIKQTRNSNKDLVCKIVQLEKQLKK